MTQDQFQKFEHAKWTLEKRFNSPNDLIKFWLLLGNSLRGTHVPTPEIYRPWYKGLNLGQSDDIIE